MLCVCVCARAWRVRFASCRVHQRREGGWVGEENGEKEGEAECTKGGMERETVRVRARAGACVRVRAAAQVRGGLHRGSEEERKREGARKREPSAPRERGKEGVRETSRAAAQVRGGVHQGRGLHVRQRRQGNTPPPHTVPAAAAPAAVG